MPLYNPFQNEPSQPQLPRKPSALQQKRQKDKLSNMTLSDMLKHSNPKIRQAAKNAVRIQTAVNTATNAAAAGMDINKFLSQNPEYASILKNAGINLTSAPVVPGIIPSYGSPVNITQAQGRGKPDQFWTRTEFKEIVAETNKFIREREVAARQQNAAYRRRSVTSYERNRRAAMNTAYGAATAPLTSTQASIQGTLNAQASAPQELQPLISTPGLSSVDTTIQPAKTLFVPKMKNGKLELDPAGNPMFEPFAPDTESPKFLKFKNSAEYKEYEEAIKERNLPHWKESWELSKFWFVQGYVAPAFQGMNNFFSIQKEFILQEDTPSIEQTTLNVAANFLQYVRSSVSNGYYAGVGDYWEKEIPKQEAELAAMRAAGQQDSYQYAQKSFDLQKMKEHAEYSKFSDESLFQSEKALKESWARYEEYKEETGEGFISNLLGLSKMDPETTERILKYEATIKAERETNAAFARENRPKAYALFEEANRLASTDPEKARDLFDKSQALMRTVQEADARSDPKDATTSYSWSQEPERKEAFLAALAALELQMGRPASRSEIRKLKMYYENTWTEFWGDAVFDVTNFIPQKWMGAAFKPLSFKFWDETAMGVQNILRKGATGLESVGLGKAAKGVTATIDWSQASRGAVKKGVNNFPVIGYLKRQQVASIASKRQNLAYNLFNRISNSYDTLDSFINDLEAVGRASDQVFLAADEASAREAFKTAQRTVPGLQAISFEEFKSMHDLMDVQNAGISFDKWGTLFKEAMGESETDLRRITESALRKTGKFKDETALMAEVTRQVNDAMNSPLSAGWTMGAFSEKFAGAYTDAHRLYKGSILFDDSISGQMALFFRKIADDQETDSLVRSAFKKANDLWANNKKMKFSEHLDHVLAGMAAGRSQGTKAKALFAAKAIENMVYAGKIAVDVWAMFVLSLNPRWIVQNYMDSSVRAWIAGSSPIDSAATMVMNMHRQLVDELGFLPIELGQSLARDGLNFSTSVTGRLVYGDWKPLPGPLGFISYWQYEVDRLRALRNLNIEEASVEASKALSQRFPEGSPLRAITNMMGGAKFYGQALSGAAQDFNTAIEFTLRLRLFHKEYFNNLKALGKVLNARGLDIANPKIQAIAQQMWDSSESNPRKLTALVNSIKRGDIADNPAGWSAVLPDGLRNRMAQLTESEYNLMVGDIRSQLDVLVTDIYKRGDKPTPDDFIKFFDDYAEDYKNAVNIQISNAKPVRNISARPGTKVSSVPGTEELKISTSAVDREKINAAIERIGRKVSKRRYDPAKSFDDFAVAMSDYRTVEVVDGNERHTLTDVNGNVRITIGKDLIENKTRGELNDLMNEVAIQAFIHKETEFAISAGFRDGAEFEKMLRLFMTDEGPAKVLNQNPNAFVTLAEELDSNPNLHRILEKTSGRIISYEATYKNYLNHLPIDQLRGKAWFDMVEARADQMHVPPAHTRHAAIRHTQQTKNLWIMVNRGDLNPELSAELRNFLSMYDQASLDLGQFFYFTEPGPGQLSGQARHNAWDEFYLRKAEAYDFGTEVKAKVYELAQKDPDEALAFVREFNTNFYENFLNSHGITDFEIIEYAPRVDVPVQGEGAYAVHAPVPTGRPPITQFKMKKGNKIWNIQSEYVRKDLYERFLSPEKKASLLSTQRFDVGAKEAIPLEDQLFTAVHDSFKLTNEQATLYSRIIKDHIEMMTAETGRDAEYYLRRMGFLRIEGRLSAPDALRRVNAVLNEEGRHLLYGFGSRNATDLIRQTSVMFYDDLLEIARDSERAMDDLMRLGDFLEIQTGKKMIGGKLLDEHLEVWADVFQKYVLTGEAPTTKLAKPFRRFSEWMSKITGNTLNTTAVADLPDDVMQIMDRMFTESQMASPEAANRTARIMAKHAGIEFKNKNDLLEKVNDFFAPIKKVDRTNLRISMLSTGRPEEEVDALVTMLEYRARAWAAMEPGRDPGEYLRKWTFVTTMADKEEALQKMKENPNFLKWFGDSKVLDEAGQPKVMYTGTPRGGFDAFDLSYANDDGNLFGPGFYFTENPEIAGEYALGGAGLSGTLPTELPDRIVIQNGTLTPKQTKDVFEYLKNKSNDSSLSDDIRQIYRYQYEDANLAYAKGRTLDQSFFNTISVGKKDRETWIGILKDLGIKERLERPASTIMPVYLSIQNPFDLDAVFTREEAIKLMEKVDSYLANWLKNSTGSPTLTGEQLYNKLTDLNTKAEINQMFKEAGYDGFTHIGGGRFVLGDMRKHRVFIALEPTQIKSIFNSGEFDVNNASVLRKMSDGLPPVPEGYVRLFRGEAVVPAGYKMPEWLKQSRDEMGMTQATGRWWSNSAENAEWYVNDAGEGKLVYVDVPQEVADAAHLPNQPREIQQFSRDIETEYYLPREWADKKKDAGQIDNNPAPLRKTGEQQFYLKSRELLASKLPNGNHKVDDVKRFLLGNGISKDEMYWSGIDEYLQYAVDGKITKQDLLRQIDENPVNFTFSQMKYTSADEGATRGQIVFEYPRESIPSWDKWERIDVAGTEGLPEYKLTVPNKTTFGDAFEDSIHIRLWYPEEGEPRWVISLDSDYNIHYIPEYFDDVDDYEPKDLIRYMQEHGLKMVEDVPAGFESNYQAYRLFDKYDDYSDTVVTLVGPKEPRTSVTYSDGTTWEGRHAQMSQHFPAEGYLYHMRSQTVTRGGTKTKVLLEIQSDAAEALEEAGVRLPPRYREQGLRQLVREAVDEGATRVAWISNPDQLYKIEQWSMEQLTAASSVEKSQSLLKFYLDDLPKTIQKTFKQFNASIKQMTVDGQVLNYIDITPDMRVSLMKAESLFKNEGAQTLGTFTKSASGKNVVGVFAGGRVDVLPHEFGHAFRTELPEADLRIIEQATGLEPGEFASLRPLFDEYRKLELGVMSPYAASLPKAEYDVYFKTLQKEAARYEKAEEMFAEGFVRYLSEGKSPIPELTTVFEKFKAWLTELWRAIKRDPALRLNKEVRGVYDRLFELPYGQIPTPTRYSSLGEVPHDVMARVFPSIASQQVVDNINAAFDAWKLRHELKGLPPEALKDFSTAKAFVNQQFDETLGDLSNEYRILKWRFEQFEDAMVEAMQKKGFLARIDDTVDKFFAPTITNFHVDDGVKTFMRNGVYNRAMYEQMMAGIQEWRKFLTNAAETGTPYPVLTGNEMKELEDWAVGAAERKAKMMDLAIHGGKYEGVSVEGALTTTNRVMLDYQDRNNFDGLMKNFFPFWMFPSRSLPYWVHTLATNPRIVMLYQKMRNMSESERYQAGAVTSKGVPLPSLENYIPIPGLDLWINAAAPMSFRYLLDMQSYGDDLMYKVRTADENDDNAYSYIAKQFAETSPIFGFTPGPWVQFSLQKAGAPSQPWSLIPQTNLIPPWIFPEMIQRSETMMNMLSPEPKWHDFLVERYIMEQVSPMVNDPSISDLDKKRKMGEISKAIAEKGSNPLWQQYYQEYVIDEKKKGGIAFITGFYPKEFSDSQADLLQARNEYIMRASAMNNNFQAKLFDIPLDEQIRWDQYRAQYRVDTPLGWLYHLYGDIGWVTDENDHLVTDPKERAKLVASRISDDNDARAYFAGAKDLEIWKNKELAALPIGANYDQTKTVYDAYYDKLLALENDLMPEYKYFGSNKPVKLIENDIRNLWWRRLAASRPAWTEGMEYEEYNQRTILWEQRLPEIAQSYAQQFMKDPQIKDYIKYLDVDQQSLDLNKVMRSLLLQSNAPSYEAWKLENDDIFTALNTVWKENYWDRYWDSVGPLKNEERDLAEMDFFGANPQPNMDTVYQWVVEKYGPDRFTRQDVQEWAMFDPNKNMEIYDIDERHLQDAGEIAVTREKVWSMLSWAGPGKQKDLLQNAFLDVGGNPNDLEAWYNLSTVGGPWQDDPEHVLDFHNKLEQAAAAINLRAPDRYQLNQFLRARSENDILNGVLAEELGRDYQDVVNLYFAKSDKLEKADFRKWKRENREVQKLIDKYFYIRKVFGYQHPLWSSYYQWKPQPKIGNMGLPVSGGLSAPATTSTNFQMTAQDRKVDQVAPTITNPSVPSFSFGPSWPYGMQNSVSNYLIDEVNAAFRGNGHISSSGRAYLEALARTHPEWRPFIYKVLNM